MKLKTSFELVRKDLVEDIANTYSVPNLKIIKTNFISDFYVVFCKVKTESELNHSWDSLNSVISVELSNDFKNDFERWNLYFFYVCDSKVKPSLKYQIENDKYFSRKIVIDDCKSGLNALTMQDLVSKFIINDDLIVSEKKCNDNDSYSSNSIVYKSIELEQLKNKDDTKVLFNKLIGLLKEKHNFDGGSNEG